MRHYSALLALIGLFTLVSCRPSEVDIADSSSLKGITGRINMGPRDAFQCYNGYSYSDDEKVQGKWIVGADGATFGAVRDGIIGSACGKTFTIKSKKNGKSAEFIIVDRIWKNDGLGGGLYNDKGRADSKSGSIGAGYFQIDIAVGAFNSLFGGHNPSKGQYEMIGLSDGSASARSKATDTLGGPSGDADSADGCNYADADKHNGWGWNASTETSCPPLSGASGSNTTGSTTASSTVGCSYTDADQHGGWGWNASTGTACPPLSSSSDSNTTGSTTASATDGCSYTDADKNDGWGWNPSTGQSCPPR